MNSKLSARYGFVRASVSSGFRGPTAGKPLGPEKSLNYTAGVVFDSGQFSFTADYFRISVSDPIGITSNFTLTDTEIEGVLADGIEAARDLWRFRFCTNAFSTASQRIDLVSTFTPLALRGNRPAARCSPTPTPR